MLLLGARGGSRDYCRVLEWDGPDGLGWDGLSLGCGLIAAGFLWAGLWTGNSDWAGLGWGCGLRSAGWAGLWAEGRGLGWFGLGWAKLGLWAVSCGGVGLGFLVGLCCLVQGWSEAGCEPGVVG